MGDSSLISTIVTPAATYDLTTLAAVKDELGISDNSTDAQLQRYLSAASAAVVQYTNRQFVVETILDSFWAHRDPPPRLMRGGLSPLQLSRWPLVSVTTVIENAVTLVVNTDYLINTNQGWLIRINDSGAPRHWPSLEIDVTFNAGFATIPGDIVDAVMRMVRNRWNAKDRDPSLRSENIPGVREVQYWVATGDQAGNMTPDVTDILDNYRVPVIA